MNGSAHIAKKCQKLYFSARPFKNWYFYAKNIIGLAMTNQFSKSFIIIFGEIICVFDCSVAPWKNMARDFFAFYHRFLMAFLQTFSQSERHLHCMSTKTAFGSIIKLPDGSVMPQIFFILPCYRCILPVFNSALQKAGEKNTHMGHQCSYIGLNFGKIVWKEHLTTPNRCYIALFA